MAINGLTGVMIAQKNTGTTPCKPLRKRRTGLAARTFIRTVKYRKKTAKGISMNNLVKKSVVAHLLLC